MRYTAIVLGLLATACAAEPAPGPVFEPVDVWKENIDAGALIVAVPGTGAYTDLGAWIDAAADAQHVTTPVVDAVASTHLNPIVLEQAIAAAQRAGFSESEIETGAVTIALWGAGVTKASSFRYVSLGGVQISVAIVGGKSACAEGALTDNLGRYNRASADADAHDLYRRAQAWLAADSAQRAHQVILVAHSWGGVVTEYLVANLAGLGHDLGPLTNRPGNVSLAFAATAGVPGLVVGFRPIGPGVHSVTSTAGETELETTLYEVNRPDDMVHNLNPSGNIEGHQYDIMFGTTFMGFYGISTFELSCAGVPGPCAPR